MIVGIATLGLGRVGEHVGESLGLVGRQQADADIGYLCAGGDDVADGLSRHRDVGESVTVALATGDCRIQPKIGTVRNGTPERLDPRDDGRTIGEGTEVGADLPAEDAHRELEMSHGGAARDEPIGA